MADTQSTHKIIVTDGGTIKNTTKDAAALKGMIDGAAKSAAGIRVPTPVKAARAAMVPESARAGKDSGTARGIGGMTGAEGRDFAKQAEGMGGLVRLYATFAANIFAATAAFGALSKAMDTSNMVKGLDQLGAASGRNLGTLSKQVAMAADGAISLRESMEAVSKASSAGMSNKQIIDMAESAKKASQALGVNMADAVSRLTRGISKLEPELLDELGLFTKVDKATQDYAKSVGKSVASLTDFEKRQAYANAVLAEAKQKFSSIDIPANPYSKLLASLQNVAQAGLELANKVLVPIISLLAQNPMALAGVMGYIGTVLLKTAIPALGSWKQGLRSAAEEAAKTAKVVKESFGEAFVEKMQARFALPDLKKKLEEVNNTIASTKKNISEISNLPKSQAISALVAGTGTDKDLANAKTTLRDRQKKMDADIAGTKTLTEAVRSRYKAEIDSLNTLIARTEVLNDANQKRESVLKDIVKVNDAVENKANVIPGALDTQTVNERIYDKLQKNSAKQNAIARAATNASIIGVRDSIALMNAELEKEGVKGWSKWSTIAKGSIAAVFSRVMGIASAFGEVGMVVAAAVGAFQLIDSFASKNSKQVAEFSSSMESLNSASSNLERTLNNIKSKDPLGSISTDSLNARATAVNELAISFGTMADNLKMAQDAANGWDKFIDWTKSLFGGGMLKNSAKEFASSISMALKGATGQAKTSATNKLYDILGVDPTDVREVNKVLSESPEKLREVMPKVSEILKQLGIEMSNVASKAKQLDDAFTQASKTYDAVLFSAVPTDNLAKLGLEMVNLSTAMSDGFKDSATALSQLVAISGDVTKLRFASPETAESLLKMSTGIKASATQLQAYRNALADVSAREQDILQKRKEILDNNTTFGSAGVMVDTYAARKQQEEAGVGDSALKGIEQVRKNLIAAMEKVQKDMEPAMAKLKQQQVESFNKGASLIEASIMQGFAKASLTVSKAFASLLSEGPGAIAAQERLGKADIDLQVANLRVTRSLIDENEQLRLVMEENNNLQAQNLLIEQKKDPSAYGKTPKEIEDALKELANNAKALTILKTGVFSGSSGMSELQKAREGVAPAGINKRNYTSEQISLAARLTTPTQQSKMSVDAQIAEKSAEKTSLAIAAMSKQMDLQVNIEKDKLAVANANLQVRKSALDLETKFSPYLTQEQLSRKLQLDAEIELNKEKSEALDLQNQLDKATRSRDAGIDRKDAKQVAEAQLEINYLIEKRGRMEERNAAAAKVRETSGIAQKLDNTKKEFDYKKSVTEAYYSIDIKNRTAQITLQEESLNSLKAIGAVSDEYIAKQETSIALAKEELRFTEAVRSEAMKISEATRNRNKQREVGGPNADTSIFDAQISAGQTAIANELTLRQAKIDTLTVQGKMNEELAKQNSLMNTLTSITETLSTLFGSAGESMGKAMQSVATAAIDYGKAQQKNVALQEKMFELQNSEGIDAEAEKLKVSKEINKNETAGYISAARGIASVAGAAKNMFKERTAGYKMLSAVEKAAHVATLAMQAKELASTVATIFPSIAAGVAKLVAQSGWLGFAGAAAFLGLMASLGYGGGGAKMPSGFDSESQQKVQGTSQMYDETGNLVNRGGGIAGDPTAKASSLTKGIQQIEEHTFSTMEYNNEMLSALKRIQTNTEGLTSIITNAGLTTSGLNGEAGKYSITTLDPARGLGPALGTALFGESSGIGKWSQKVYNQVFGGGITKSLEGIGLKITNTLDNISAGLFSSLDGIYRNIKVVEDGGWFSSDDVWFEKSVEPIGDKLKESLQLIFTDVGKVVKESAAILGQDPEITKSVMDSFKVLFNVDFKDMKPEDLQAAFNAELSNNFNRLAESLFPNLAKYRKPTEEFGNTIIRLASDIQDTGVALKMAGMSIGNVAGNLQTNTVTTTKVSDAFLEVINTVSEGLSGVDTDVIRNISSYIFKGSKTITETSQVTETIQEATVRITESLIELSGGLDNFLSRSEFFTQNFLTEAERLAPVKENVSTELTRLGGVARKYNIATPVDIATLTTREGFADVVQSLDLATEGGRELYTGLMGVAEGFAAVYEETRKTTSILKDLIKENADLQDQYDKLTMSSSEYIDKITTGMSPTDKAAYVAESDKNANLKDKIANVGETKKLNDLQVDLLKAQGKDTEALALARSNELSTLGPLQAATRQLVFDMQDAIDSAKERSSLEKKYWDLDVELLRAQGKESEALILSREKEIAALDPENQAIQRLINTKLDLIETTKEETALTKKYWDLDVEMLKAQGKDSEALILSREREIAKLDPANQAIQRLIFAREDEIKVLNEAKGIKEKYADLEVELLKAQGKEQEATNLIRDKELKALDPANRELQKLVYAREDEIAAITEQNRLMKSVSSIERDIYSALGFDYAATSLSRTETINDLTTSVEKSATKYLYTMQDLMTTQGLEIDLMEAEGKTTSALIARRRLELRGLSATDQQLKIRIWRLQDEKELMSKYNNQQVTILNLLGKSSEALVLSRQMELETIDEQLRPAQLYIWALEDEQKLKDELKEAYSKQKDTLKSTISTLKDASKALKEYRDSLLISDKSILTPEQKYAEAKRQALQLAAIATSVATTETERLAKDAAISKLPGATDAWLEASRTLYASSEAYTSDFNTVLSILDQTSSALDAQQTDAEKQLTALNESVGYLSSLDETGRSVEAILKDISTATAATAAAKAAVPAGAPTVSNVMATANSGTYGAANTMWTTPLGQQATTAEIVDYVKSNLDSSPAGVYWAAVNNGFSSAMMDAILGLSPGSSLKWALENHFPAFAKGGLASGYSIVGENGPELVDFQSPGRVYSNNNTMAMMGNTADLLNELKALREEVAKLREEQREQTGHLIQSNYDANAKAAEKVAESNQDAANNARWNERNKVKIM